MKVIAHFKEKSGRIAEEEFEVLEVLPQKGENYDGEIVKEVRKIEAIPELGIETLANFDFYKVKLTVMKEYDEESQIYYVMWVAIKKKPFNRLLYVINGYEKNDTVLYMNDDDKTCKSALVDIKNRENALSFIKGIQKEDLAEWFDESYEEEMEDHSRGLDKILAEIECSF